MWYVGNVLALSALVTGLLAAFYWYKSSNIEVDPGWTPTNPEPVIQEHRDAAWRTATLRAMTESAKLNKKASLWTALSVALSGASAVIGPWV